MTTNFLPSIRIRTPAILMQQIYKKRVIFQKINFLYCLRCGFFLAQKKNYSKLSIDTLCVETISDVAKSTISTLYTLHEPTGTL